MTPTSDASSDSARTAAAPEFPVTSCILCTVPRSGSWLLAEGLLATGVLGRPEEYFRPDWYLRFRATGDVPYQHRLHRIQDWPDGIPWDGAPLRPGGHLAQVPAGHGMTYRSFLSAVRSIGTSGAVFAMKVHRHQLDEAVARAQLDEPDVGDVSLLRSWLPEPRFVLLRREDPVRRAVSHFRAIRSDVWWRDDGDDGGSSHDAGQRELAGQRLRDPAVDPEAIEKLLHLCAVQEQQWQDFFRRASVVPLELSYEELARDLDAAVRAVARHLGVTVPLPQTPRPPRLRRQADSWTDGAVHTYLTWRRANGPLDDREYGFDESRSDDIPATEPGGVESTVSEEAVSGGSDVAGMSALPAARRAIHGDGAPGSAGDRNGQRRARASEPTGRGRSPFPRARGEWDPAGSSLADFLGARRWIRRLQPFPHVVAFDVFRPAVYQRLERAFVTLLEGTAGRPYMTEHDIYGRTIEPDIADRFAPLLTRPWHDLLARVLDISATGHVAAGMHHHRVGSNHGFPHNDLNPGWFLGESEPSALVVSGPGIDYTTGTLSGPQDAPPVEMIRAAAALFYLANSEWQPGDGGATGLYRSADDDIRRPAGMAPPLNNSLLVFECTPMSFHGFISNRRIPRNSIVMWLHRPKDEVIARWGEDAIVPYGGKRRKKAEQ